MPKKNDPPPDAPSSAPDAAQPPAPELVPTDAPPPPAAPDAAHPDTEPAPALEPTLPDEIPPEGPPIEEHAAAAGTHPAIFAAMKAYFRFGEGRRMSREHYDAAIHKVENLKFQ
jgi:hypothetical protein